MTLFLMRKKLKCAGVLEKLKEEFGHGWWLVII